MSCLSKKGREVSLLFQWFAVLAANVVQSKIVFRELENIQRSYAGLTRLAKREVVVRWEMTDHQAMIEFLRKPSFINE